MSWWLWTLVAVLVVLAGTTVYDVGQKKHAILRNYPVVGHLRFALERIGPELFLAAPFINRQSRACATALGWAPLGLQAGGPQV